tara:strand:+ start:987 stop:1163 length:177 start_codon:yes stop_codon:yes gene_type:complete
MINVNAKKFYITKSKYPIADKYSLEGSLNRYNKELFNVEVFDKGRSYLVIITPKVEVV